MKTSLVLAGVFIVATFPPGRAADTNTDRADRLIAALEGTYKLSFVDGTVGGETYIATDSLTLARAPGSSIHFTLHLNFYNGHECNASGTAQYQANGEFVYRERFDKRECALEIVPTEKAILLRDPTGNCKINTCGLRGGYEGASFARSLRQPLTPSAAAR
jgi:hypothetical protein